MKNVLPRLLLISLAVGLLLYALKDVSPTDILNQFRRADYGWMAVAAAAILTTYWLRGKRWQQALLAMDYHPTAFRAMIAMQTGMVTSMIVVGSGELTRCLTLQRTDGVPMAQSLGSVVAERVLDLLVLGLVVLLTLTLEFGRMSQYLTGLSAALPGSVVWVGLVVIMAGGLGLYGLWRSPAVRQNPLVVKVVRFLAGLWEGFTALRQLPNPGLFVLLTLLIQVFTAVSIYCMLLSVHMIPRLPPVASLTILMVASLGGLAVPTQGGIGTYHFLVSRVLVLYGLTTGEGAALATFLHAAGFGINLLLNSLSFLILPLLLAQARQRQPNPQPHS
jgi:glycosyltransferase 2 family protein